MVAALWKVFRESFARAAKVDFPPFLGPIQSSTPLNSTPYVAHLSDAANGEIMPNRADLLQELVVAVEELRSLGLEAVAALLGGSAIGSKPDPADLDCVIFYRARDQEAAANPTLGLAGFQQRMKARRLDLRLVPADGDPLLLIKTVSFFTTLYTTSPRLDLVRGLVLLDCRPGYGP